MKKRMRNLGTIAITVMIPLLLVLLSARLVMTPLFFQLEYTRPGFPVDTYGFDTVDRLEYGPIALNYLITNADVDYFENFPLPIEKCWEPEGNRDTCPLFNERELAHMEDVQTLTQYGIWLGIGLLVGLAMIVIGFWRQGNRISILRGLFQGSLLTLGIITSLVLFSIIAWDRFFTQFHQLFFASGTWRFPYSDTLIRLYPEQFWFDAAITIGILTTVGALLLFGISWRMVRRLSS